MGEETSATRPEKSFRVGAVRASVWKNVRHGKDGKTFEMRAVTLDRTYKDSDGNYKTTNRFAANEIPKAILLLERAYEYLVMGAEEEPDASSV
jgi:hypothetical protein